MAETILMIDDDLDIREIVRVNLEGAGYRVLCASDGVEGLAAARDHQPDLIILDVLMPGLDGWQVLDQLVNDPRTADRPIIMLTCRGEDQDILRGLDSGASEYITKPFYPEHLVTSVKLLLNAVDPNRREERHHNRIQRRQQGIGPPSATSPRGL